MDFGRGAAIVFILYKLMIRTNRFAFSTIALISGAPRYDEYTARIAATLQKVSGEKPTIVGVVGSAFESTFSKVYASSSHLDNHPFEVTRPFSYNNQVIQDSWFVPYRTFTHYTNYTLMKQLEQSGFFSDVFNNKFSAVVTVNNFCLSLRVGQKLEAYSKQNNTVRPYTAIFDPLNTERIIENEQLIDFQYYNLERAQYNRRGYIFPSMCVGYESLYQAFQHLSQFKTDNSSSFASERFSYDVSQLVNKSRSQFRKEKGISEDTYIYYIDAGSNASQINFSFKAIKDGFRTFFNQQSVSGINKAHFEIFVRVPQQLSQEVKNKLGFLPNDVKVTLIEDRDRYGAISAADFGLIHNGDATLEAAGLQLPALVLDNRSNAHAYFNNLLNGHASPLNIATNYEAYEDLCGSLTANGNKISLIMLKNFESPKYRYYYAKLYREQIQKILSKSDTNPNLNVSETGLETGCKHLLERVAIFEKTNSASLKKIDDRKDSFVLW